MVGYTSRQSALPAAARCRMPGNFGRTGFLLIVRSQSFALRQQADHISGLPTNRQVVAGCKVQQRGVIRRLTD